MSIRLNDSGFFLSESSYDLQEIETIESEKKDRLTPLQNSGQKPLNYYKKNLEKPFSEFEIFNKKKEAEEKSQNPDGGWSRQATNQPSAVYQTTFIRIWPINPSDFRWILYCDRTGIVYM